jgi:hypothetical protein
VNSWVYDDRTTQCANTYTITYKLDRPGWTQVVDTYGNPIPDGTLFTINGQAAIADEDGWLYLGDIPVDRNPEIQFDTVWLKPPDAPCDGFPFGPMDVATADDENSYVLDPLPRDPVRLLWIDGQPIANESFLINGQAVETNSLGQADFCGISILRNPDYSVDTIFLKDNAGGFETYTFDPVDISAALANGEYTVSLKEFQVVVRWPNNQLATEISFFFDDQLRTTNDVGEVDLHRIPQDRTEDCVYIISEDEIITARIKLPALLDINSVIEDGTYTIDLCGWAQESTRTFIKYWDEYEFTKEVEENLRAVVETNYSIKYLAPLPYSPGGWAVIAEVPVYNFITTTINAIETLFVKSWASFAFQLFVNFGFDGELEYWGEALDSVVHEDTDIRDLYKYVGYELAKEAAFRLSLKVKHILTEDVLFGTEKKAEEAVKDMQRHALMNWKTFEPIYKSTRAREIEVQDSWKDAAATVKYIRERSNNPEACVLSSDYSIFFLPTPILPEVEEPTLPEPFKVTTDNDYYLPSGSLWVGVPTIPDTPPGTFDFLGEPESQSNHPEYTYTWSSYQPNSVTVVGDLLTFEIPSVSEQDTGIYVFSAFDELGNLFHKESFGVYLKDASVAPPTLASLMEAGTATVGEPFLYIPEIVSEVPASISWEKDGIALENPEPSLFLESVTLEDAGIYRLIIENPGGSASSDVLELTVKSPEVTQWASYPIVEDSTGQYVDTGTWIGWIEVTARPWIWHLGTNSWFYTAETVVESSSGWIYIPDLTTDVPELWLVMEGETSWGYSYGLSKWMYVTESGWVYLIG